VNLLQKIRSRIDEVARFVRGRRVIEDSVRLDFVGNRDQNLFHGVHDSFEAAQAESYGVAGYDNEASANLYLDHVRVDGSDILFASGSLQYLPQRLAHYLGEWSKLPRRIVINITPIHSVQSYFTVNGIGTAFCAYRVQTHADLVRGLSPFGYRMRDHWLNRGKHLTLPLNPALSLDHYSGCCFDLPP